VSAASTPPSEEELPTPAVQKPTLDSAIGVGGAHSRRRHRYFTAHQELGERGSADHDQLLERRGVQVGKTLVKYRDVTVGRVSAVVLSPDHQTVMVTADLSKDAASLLKADTQFWIVRPRFGVGSVSGLETLLSGVYIA